MKWPRLDFALEKDHLGLQAQVPPTKLVAPGPPNVMRWWLGDGSTTSYHCGSEPDILGALPSGILHNAPGALVCATELTLASITAKTHFMCDPAHSRGSCAIHVQPPSLTTPLRARPGWSQALPTQTALAWRRGIHDALCAL